MAKTTWTRRELLARSGATAILLAPVLSGRTARAQRPPGRLLAMNFPNGSPGNPRDVFFPSGGENHSSWDFSGRVTEPLAAFSDRMAFVRGLRTNRGRRPTGSHGGGNICFLTGTNELNHPSSDFHTPQNASVDNHIANFYGEDALYVAVGLNGRANSRMSWVGDDTPNTEISDPQAAYDQAFGGWSDLCDADAAALTAHISRETLVLDALTEDVANAKTRYGLVGQEREKLERFADGLSDLQNDLDELASGETCTPTTLPDLEMSDGSDAERMAALRRIAVFALALQTRRVVSLQLFHGYNNFNYNGIVADAPSTGHHNLTHASGSNSQAQSRSIIRWHMERLAEMATELDSLPGDDGTSALDEVVILLGTDTPNAFTHSYGEDAPTLLLGGGAGRLNTGIMTATDARNHVDILATLCALLEADGQLYETRAGFGGLVQPLLA